MMMLRASPALRSATTQARRYATGPTPAKQPNWGLYLAASGCVGLAAYLYIDSPFALKAKDTVKEATKPKATNTESPLNKDAFVDLKLKKIEPYNWNTDKVTFELPNGDASLLPVASCVIFKGPEELKDAKGKPVIRPYTPTSASDEPGELEFVIKRYEGGLMSQHIHKMQPGDTLAIKGPIPKIPWKINEFDHVGMVVGGTGITPMWQILQHALTNKENKTKFTLIFGNNEERDILLKKEFEYLEKEYPDTFKMVHVLSSAPETWKGAKGFITPELMKEHFAKPGDNVKILVCGPPPQVAAIAGAKDGMKQGDLKGALKELGYTPEQVFKF